MTAATQPRKPRPTVVIPAHNEEAGISRCLTALLSDPAAASCEIVVVANGCTDSTASAARSFAGVTTVELEQASKVAALNLGDDHGSGYPRIYLDGDIELRGGALTQLIRALDDPTLARLAVPAVNYDTRDCSTLVRLFFDVAASLPARTSGTTGRGVYALSRAGRARFGAFPEVQSDDLFIARQFAAQERIHTGGHSIVRPPLTLRSLIRTRRRIAAGNAVLAATSDPTGGAGAEGSTRETVRALASLTARDPRKLPGALVYTAVVASARLQARRDGGSTWHRDTSRR